MTFGPNLQLSRGSNFATCLQFTFCQNGFRINSYRPRRGRLRKPITAFALRMARRPSAYIPAVRLAETFFGPHEPGRATRHDDHTPPKARRHIDFTPFPTGAGETSFWIPLTGGKISKLSHYPPRRAVPAACATNAAFVHVVAPSRAGETSTVRFESFYTFKFHAAFANGRRTRRFVDETAFRRMSFEIEKYVVFLGEKILTQLRFFSKEITTVAPNCTF